MRRFEIIQSETDIVTSHSGSALCRPPRACGSGSMTTPMP